ncbi:membrane protein [Streptococcus agalactiae GB00899]|nr:membrane protein [Streptococcus agalactiae GB00899]
MALFSITTVLISFLLLALSLTPVWSFLLAMLASLAVTSAVSSFIWSLRQ